MMLSRWGVTVLDVCRQCPLAELLQQNHASCKMHINGCRRDSMCCRNAMKQLRKAAITSKLILLVLHFVNGLLYVMLSLCLGLRQSGSLLVDLLAKLSHSTPPRIYLQADTLQLVHACLHCVVSCSPPLHGCQHLSLQLLCLQIEEQVNTSINDDDCLRDPRGGHTHNVKLCSLAKTSSTSTEKKPCFCSTYWSLKPLWVQIWLPDLYCSQKLNESLGSAKHMWYTRTKQ